jgi:hypothetical protein
MLPNACDPAYTAAMGGWQKESGRGIFEALANFVQESRSPVREPKPEHAEYKYRTLLLHQTVRYSKVKIRRSLFYSTLRVRTPNAWHPEECLTHSFTQRSSLHSSVEYTHFGWDLPLMLFHIYIHIYIYTYIWISRHSAVPLPPLCFTLSICFLYKNLSARLSTVLLFHCSESVMENIQLAFYSNVQSAVQKVNQ